MENANEVEHTVHQTRLILLKTIPPEIDAGAEIPLEIEVRCCEKCSPLGGKLKIMDAAGKCLQRAELAFAGGNTAKAENLCVQAPLEPGEYSWTAVYEAAEQEQEGIHHQESSAQLAFKVRPHTIVLSAWGVLQPVCKGDKFKVHFGARCSAGCSLAGLNLVIKDEHGETVRGGQLGKEVLPQTSATYWMELELPAPDDEALHKWSAHCLTADLDWAHQTSPVGFAFRTAQTPEHTVTIEVVRKGLNCALEEANIMLGIHRASTDKDGIARVKVPPGPQELIVSKNDHLSCRTMVEIQGDAKLKAELEFFPIL